MKARNLIEILSTLPPETEVLVGHEDWFYECYSDGLVYEKDGKEVDAYESDDPPAAVLRTLL